MAPNKESAPVTVNLLSELESDKYRAMQEAIRSEVNEKRQEELKLNMPVILVSGVFHGGKSSKCLVSYTRLIVVDIDEKDNKNVENFFTLKTEFCKIPNVAYCGRSIRGKGYWLIIPVAYPDKHVLHFEFLKNWFLAKGLKIDSSGENINRLRFYSYDEEAYYNHTAEPLWGMYSPQPVKLRQKSPPKLSGLEKPVWRAYNECDHFIEVLENHGWTVYKHAEKKIFFTRPGKSSGNSAEFDRTHNVFYVFTENGDPFEANKGYNPFQVYTLLEHKGDFTKAAKDLSKKSGVSQTKPSTQKTIHKPEYPPS
jgi:hypothetical protein